MGQRYPRGHWRSWENVETKLREFIDELNGKFPTAIQLINRGLGGVVQAIYKHHGGLSAVRRRMGYAAVDDEEMCQYSTDIARSYMQQATEDDRFDKFVERIRQTCKTERDLKAFLGIEEKHTEDRDRNNAKLSA